jgi:hypothetical protein
MTTATESAALVPVSRAHRDRLSAHAEELRLAGQIVVAEIVEGIVDAFDAAVELPAGALQQRNGHR